MSDKQRTIHRKNIPHKHLSWLDGIMNLEAFKITVYAKGDFVKQVWTKEQCQDLDHRFLEQEIKFKGKIDQVNQRIDNFEKQVNQKFDQVNQRIDNFEKKVNQRIDNLETRIDKLESKMDKQFDEVNKTLQTILSVFKKNKKI